MIWFWGENKMLIIWKSISCDHERWVSRIDVIWFFSSWSLVHSSSSHSIDMLTFYLICSFFSIFSLHKYNVCACSFIMSFGMIGVAYSIIHISTSNPPGWQIRAWDGNGNGNGMREKKFICEETCINIWIVYWFQLLNSVKMEKANNMNIKYLVDDCFIP